MSEQTVPVKVSGQQLLDAGLNVFGLQLFLKSVAAQYKPNPDNNDPLEFAFEYRNTSSVVKIWLSTSVEARDER